MRVCQLNDCENAATFAVIPVEIPKGPFKGSLKDIWVCDNCEIESDEKFEYIEYEWKRRE